MVQAESNAVSGVFLNGSKVKMTKRPCQSAKDDM